MLARLRAKTEAAGGLFSWGSTSRPLNQGTAEKTKVRRGSAPRGGSLVETTSFQKRPASREKRNFNSKSLTKKPREKNNGGKERGKEKWLKGEGGVYKAECP